MPTYTSHIFLTTAIDIPAGLYQHILMDKPSQAYQWGHIHIPPLGEGMPTATLSLSMKSVSIYVLCMPYLYRHMSCIHALHEPQIWFTWLAAIINTSHAYWLRTPSHYLAFIILSIGPTLLRLMLSALSIYLLSFLYTLPLVSTLLPHSCCHVLSMYINPLLTHTYMLLLICYINNPTCFTSYLVGLMER